MKNIISNFKVMCLALLGFSGVRAFTGLEPFMAGYATYAWYAGMGITVVGGTALAYAQWNKGAWTFLEQCLEGPQWHIKDSEEINLGSDSYNP